MNLFNDNDDDGEESFHEEFGKYAKIHAYENLDKAMQNGYLIITGRITFEDLLLDDEVWLSFDISDYDEENVLKDLIEYFEETEEYEKCQELTHLLKMNENEKKLT
jgi:hypothetical protein